jgi:hypothetical protein
VTKRAAIYCRVSTSDQRIELGQIVATPGALDSLEESKQSPCEFLLRHASGDWGDLSLDDRKENEFSLGHGFRLLSAYTLNSGVKVWVITEADRSSTTLLLPEEY